MSKTLHILNGDTTLPNLEKSGIKGEVVVWREMLCEGPVHKEVGSDDFWMNRCTFFENEIVRKLLIWQHNETVYWFEDLQYFQYLKKIFISNLCYLI